MAGNSVQDLLLLETYTRDKSKMVSVCSKLGEIDLEEIGRAHGINFDKYLTYP